MSRKWQDNNEQPIGNGLWGIDWSHDRWRQWSVNRDLGLFGREIGSLEKKSRHWTHSVFVRTLSCYTSVCTACCATALVKGQEVFFLFFFVQSAREMWQLLKATISWRAVQTADQSTTNGQTTSEVRSPTARHTRYPREITMLPALRMSLVMVLDTHSLKTSSIYLIRNSLAASLAKRCGTSPRTVFNYPRPQSAVSIFVYSTSTWCSTKQIAYRLQHRKPFLFSSSCCGSDAPIQKLGTCEASRFDSIWIRIGRPILLDLKGIGRFENFLVVSAVSIRAGFSWWEAWGPVIGIEDGRGGKGPPKKIPENFFSGKHNVKFGHFRPMSCKIREFCYFFKQISWKIRAFCYII